MGNFLNQEVNNALSVRANLLIRFDEEEKGQCLREALIWWERWRSIKWQVASG